MNRALTARQVAALLLIPAALIFLTALPLVPWLVQTKARLDNSYWETQLMFATISLCVAALSAPFLFIRLYCSASKLVICGWYAVVVGYLAVFAYVVQSHFPLGPKLIVAGGVAALASVAGYGLKLDFSRLKPPL